MGGGGDGGWRRYKIENNSLGRLETCSNRSERVFDGFKRVNLTGFRRVSTGLDGFQRVLHLTRTHQECYVDFFFVSIKTHFVCKLFQVLGYDNDI